MKSSCRDAWYVNQNKIAVGFLKITFYSLEKVISLLDEKVCVFSVIASQSLKSFSEQDSNLKPGLRISRKDRKYVFANWFFKVPAYALVFT